MSIVLINKAGVDQGLITSAFEAAEMPEKRVLLVMNDSPIRRSLLGYCMPRELQKYATGTRVDLARYWKESWECAVVISKKGCDYSRIHPVYFTALLAHEFGHAKARRSSI